LPRLVEIYEKYESQGVKIVSIDSGTRSTAASEFLTENNVRHLVLNDLKDEVTSAYRVVAIPVTVLIDHEGRVMYRHLGFADEMVPRLEGEIETLLAWKDAS
jgi:peroxiredoxin